MSAVSRRHRWKITAGIAIASLAAVTGLAGVFALGGVGSGGGNATRLALPFQEGSTATAEGVTITLRSAAFSGTATLLSVRVDIPGTEPGTVTSIALPRDGLVGGTLPPVGPASGGVVKGTSSGELMLRMAAVSSTVSQSVEIGAVDVRFRDGSARRISGKWILTVAVPANVADLIRTERLDGGANARVQGIEVTAIGGLRSSTETLVTLQFKGPTGLTLLGQPALNDRGQILFGAQVDSSSDGTTTTYSFPPTSFGAPVSVSLTAFSLPNESASVVIDLARVFADNRITGGPGERGAVSPAAVVNSTRPNLPVTSVAFTRTNSNNFEIYLGVPLNPNDPSPITLVLATGESIVTSSKDIGYNRDAAGTIIGGQTQLIFPAPALSALTGNVRLNLGAGSQVVNGQWIVELRPR